MITAARDPARQPERTRLAWRRTVLAAIIVLLLALRLAALTAHPISALVVAAALTGFVVLLSVSWRRIVTLAARQPPAALRSPAATAWIVVGLAGLGIVLVATRT